MEPSSAANYRPLSKEIRQILLIAGGLVLLAAFQLFVFSEQTDQYFAWTIQPPLTAAFLGAGYLASAILEFLAARERLWAQARIAVSSVLLFTVMTAIATLVHIDRFHLSSPNMVARGAAWFWIGIYTIVPPLMLALLLHQMLIPGVDPPRRAVLRFWLVPIFWAQSALMLGSGVVLFLVPQSAGSFWPWQLTPLTARAVAAWMLGVGLGALLITLENDYTRLKPAMVSYTAFGALQLIALARYFGEVNWNGPRAWAYLLFLLSILAVGLYGWRAERRLRTSFALAE